MNTPAAAPTTLLASLYSVQASADQQIALDDEGGATNEQSQEPIRRAGIGRGDVGRLCGVVGGFLGFGLAGAAHSQVSRPIGVAPAIVGVARTFYTNIFGKGHEMSFPADTQTEIQLAPGPTGAR